MDARFVVESLYTDRTAIVVAGPRDVRIIADFVTGLSETA